MRKRTFLITVSFLITLLVISGMFAFANAQTAEELLQAPGLTSTQRAAIAEAIAKQQRPTDSLIPTSLKGMLEWREMGEAFATTIESICKTLSVEVNEFLKSDVGMLTAAVIIYKMVGRDIVQILLYTGIWIGVTFFIMLSIKFLHMKKKIKQQVLDPENESEKAYVVVYAYVDRFGWPSDDGELWKMTSLFIHIIAWFIFTCVIATYIVS